MWGRKKSDGLVLVANTTKGRLFDNLNYGSKMPSYMPVESIEGNKITAAQPFERFVECREIAVGEVRAVLYQKKMEEADKFQGFLKLHYLVTSSSRNKGVINNIQEYGPRILHTFDKILGCRPTKLRRVETLITSHETRSNISDRNVFLVEADKPWSKAPELVSLHMLLLRLGKFDIFSGVKKVPYDKVPDFLVDKATKNGDKERDEDGFPDEDLIRIRIHMAAWIKILKEYEKRFANKKFSTTFRLYQDDAGSGMLYDNGIDSLVEPLSGKSVDDEIDQYDEDDDLDQYDEDGEED